VDLFGPSLMDDLVDITSMSTAMPNAGPDAVPEIDLFATAAFQSANAPLETASGSHAQVSFLFITVLLILHLLWSLLNFPI
jgi:epsin